MSFDASLCLNTVLPLAQAAYNPAFLPTGWEIVAKIEPEDFGYIVKQVTADRVRVAILFAGTRDFEQWLKDFDTVWVPAQFGGPGHVHRGFQRQYSLIRASILAGLQGLVWDELWIIGHSLGAALALLCAAELASHQPSVWTLEGPRTGWFDWSHWFDQVITTCWRLCAHWDIVWHQPNDVLGYVHVGTQILLEPPFTLDVHVNHAIDPSVKVGLQKLIAAA